MTRKEKIAKARRLLTGELTREPKGFIVIIREGEQSCSDPDWPDNVLPDDVVIGINVLSDEEVKKRFESRNSNKDNGNGAELINNEP
jgi:hypothetical protein